MTVTVHTVLPANGSHNISVDPEMVMIVSADEDILGMDVYVNGDVIGKWEDGECELNYPDYRGGVEPGDGLRRFTLRFRSRRRFLSSGKVTVRYVIQAASGDTDVSTEFFTQASVGGVLRRRVYVIDSALPAAYVASSVVQTTLRGLLLQPSSTTLFVVLVRVTAGGTLRSFGVAAGFGEEELADADALNPADLITLDAAGMETQLSVLGPLWPAFLDELRDVGVLTTTIDLIDKTWRSANRIHRLEAAAAGLLFLNQALS